MMNKKSILRLSLFFVLFPLTFLCCQKVEEIKQKSNEKISNSEIIEEVSKLYKKAKESGEQVPDNISDWIKEDISRIGDWEYKVLHMEIEAGIQKESFLNIHGRQRWECFWVRENGEEMEFYFKRPARSYLKSIPLKNLIKLIPIESTQSLE